MDGTEWNPGPRIAPDYAIAASRLLAEDVFEAALKQGYKISYDHFDIEIEFKDFPVLEYENRNIKIKPFPVLDLYDYRISGKVDENGFASIRFENNNIPSLPPENISTKIVLPLDGSYSYPGEIYIDLRVYDRDPDSIDNIIHRGLKDPSTGEFVGKSEARQILNEYYGVGIYREQFRIRPYGEQSFDWLDLDKLRVQKPARKLGHNQVIGFVYIRPEESSGLTEKSARDGLTENSYYYGLKQIVSRFIMELESRRVQYREKTLKGGRAKNNIEDDINHIFDFDNVSKHIKKELDGIEITKPQREAVSNVITVALEVERKNKSKIVKHIKETIAIYQGQVTLGKIAHVLLHEGRKNIKYISETVPRVIKWSKEISVNYDQEKLERLEDRGERTINHAKALSYLFKKIEPLARTRRSPAKKHDVKKFIEESFDLFSIEIKDLDIECIVGEALRQEERVVFANDLDLITVFSNLTENSIYWLRHKETGKRKIQVDMYSENGKIFVEYSDNGPGFQGSNLESMFEPGYSAKPDGTGLGLALAGESMSRIGGSIEAINSENGASFNIVFPGNGK